MEPREIHHDLCQKSNIAGFDRVHCACEKTGSSTLAGPIGAASREKFSTEKQLPSIRATGREKVVAELPMANRSTTPVRIKAAIERSASIRAETSRRLSYMAKVHALGGSWPIEQDPANAALGLEQEIVGHAASVAGEWIRGKWRFSSAASYAILAAKSCARISLR